MRGEDFDRDTEGEMIWVAERDKRLVGFVSTWEAENFVRNPFVRPGATGKDVGSALLHTCISHLGRTGILMRRKL